MTATNSTSPDLVVLSHLRWTWVWQRPQHLVSRFARMRAEGGGRTWFVEEPSYENVTDPELRVEEADGIWRVWLALPALDGGPKAPGFDAPGTRHYGRLLLDLFAEENRAPHPDVLVYTPLALDSARALAPRVLAYDVMDDLASFKDAPAGLRLADRRLLAAADVVFAGGRTLHETVSARRPGGVHLFPSGVDHEHYAASRAQRALRPKTAQKIAGYVGVIDERLDLGLIDGLAEALPDWTIRLVGPTAKIDQSNLPKRSNIEYPGMADYADLPSFMAGFDVALMPFALNEATRSISPTKTLEYLAAGLPVVSTRIADVVSDFGELVHLADNATGFAAACAHVIEQSSAERDERAQPIQERHGWDRIATAMSALIDSAGQRPRRRALDNATASGSGASRLSMEMESAHAPATSAAAAGLQDPALAEIRLSGPSVTRLADAAVSSATPYVRAPLLARISAALVLHPPGGDEHGRCETCGTAAPCATARALKW